MTKRRLKWRFAVDTGGTFTDVIGMDTSGEFHSLKLLSRSPGYEDASIEGIKRIMGLDPGQKLPEDRIDGIRFGTTVATNALLERKGGRVALLITKGFRDLLEIGYQNRPDIFRLCIRKPDHLYTRVIEISERTDCEGRVVREIDEERLLKDIEKNKMANVDAFAVVLLHSWKNPKHEVMCEKILLQKGFSNIFLSHQTVNLIKVVSRGQSTIIDAYLSVTLARYLDTLRKHTGCIPLEFMQSNGMLTGPELFKGKNAILSGPAGGVVAVARIAEDKNIKGVIGFDMGGTSTDVSRFDGEFQSRYEQSIEDILLQVEMLDINTVASGGGSILRFDGQKIAAGPESAGSYPGPACYGFNGPLTITDANLITGRIVPEYFPRTFGADCKSPLDTEIVKKKFQLLVEEINLSLGTSLSAEETANGFLRVANGRMAMAIKEISVSRGFDVRDYSLVCFGGAGGQHACAIASLLDIKTIIIHPLSSLMSAYGIGMSKPAVKTTRSILKPYDINTHGEMNELFREMENRLVKKWRTKNHEKVTKREIDLRPAGSDTYITVNYAGYGEVLRDFENRYEKLFGFSIEKGQAEIVNLRLTIIKTENFMTLYRERNKLNNKAAYPAGYQNIFFTDRFVKVPVYLRDSLPAIMNIKGPAVIVDPNATIVVNPEFKAEVDEYGNIIMTRITARTESIPSATDRPDPVLLEVFNSIFKGIATEMGYTLQNTAYSVNIKERLDFSCAVFDSAGNLAANAPHIPVHLGSMADTVKSIIKMNHKSFRPGDMYLTNNPYKGGSHLPDMTLVCPVFSEEGNLIFFTAARGHHADIGGITPGSMPPSSSHIDEEGVLVDNFLLVRDGSIQENTLKELFLNHQYPVRNISDCLHDIRAQVAACNKGVKELETIVGKYGINMVTAYMQFIQDHSEYLVRKVLHGFLKGKGSFRSNFEDYLDDGTLIKAAISIDGGEYPPDTISLVIDFTGTGEQHSGDNLNAPESITRSAVLYVLRSLIEGDIPLNGGCLKPVRIIIPEGSIINPVYPASVASGNVETSQRVVDVLLGSFGIAAASQGTMNNLLFEVHGEASYYETIAGGSGAVDGCRGTSGVQVHMTNTRITDPEVLEFRHPGVRLEQFRLRRGSGGKGRFRGGDGVIRELRFLEPATVSIISERRVYAPYGIEDGDPGKRGINILKKADKKARKLKHREILRLDRDDVIIIKTPGGGGFGKIK